MAARYRIDVVTDPPAILGPDATGLVESIQAVRVVVRADVESTSHVVVRAATPPFLLESGDDRIRPLFPGVVVSLVQVDVAGRATISCSGTTDRARFAAAAAVATLKRAWGWDESPTITITFENDGRELVLNPVAEGAVWWVDVAA